MPEGPEAKIMVDSLQKYVGSKLTDLKITSGRYIKHKLPNNYSKFLKDLSSKIKKINCKGKFIYIILENDWTIWITLGMIGHFVFKKYKHSHYTFETSKGKFYLDDVRNFGTINFNKLNDKKCNLNERLNKLGLDPLQEQITFDTFLEKYNKFTKRSKNKLIAALLLDQKFIAGIGNYLRSDILYTANINPQKKLSELSKQKLEDLYNAILKIMKESYKKQSKDSIHTYNFKIYQRDYTRKGEKVYSYKVKDRTIFTTYKN